MTEKKRIQSRYPEDRSLGEDLGLWWVLHTKPNCERQVAEYLLNRNISYYLPLVRKRVRYGNLGRTRVQEQCLFRGYICLALAKEEHRQLYDTKKLVRIIKVDDQELFVRELDAICRAIETREELLVQPGLVPGRRVLILSGPLAGSEGTVVRLKKEKHLGLAVHMFNQTVLVKLDPFTKVEPI